MTERVADIDARLAGVQQLGAVVNAMRGIAAARVQQARGQLAAVDVYAGAIAAAIGLALAATGQAADAPRAARPALVIFCAEQGFAGSFSERVLDGAGADLASASVFLIGTRGRSVAAERGVKPDWTGEMPAHSNGIPRLADDVAEALFAGVASGEIGRIDAVFSEWRAGRGTAVARHRLIPLDPAGFAAPPRAAAPLLNLSPDALLADLTADYLHAQLCHAALHAFAAENEARMAAMAEAHAQTKRQLAELQATQRRVRQDEITAEIIELAAGVVASRTPV